MTRRDPNRLSFSAEQAAKAPLITAIRRAMGEVDFAIPPFDPRDVAETLRALAKLRVRAAKFAPESAVDRPAVFAELAAALRETRARLQELDEPTRSAYIEKYQHRF